MARISPLLVRCDQDEPSVFVVENLQREARRQLNTAEGQIPEVCLLDPDGDVVRHVERSQLGRRSAVWACYHTDLFEIQTSVGNAGIVGCAVGAPFAVLVAEELFASGCKLLISLSSAGRIASDTPQSCIVIIDRALRGEGTSYAYLPPGEAVEASQSLAHMTESALEAIGIPLMRGTTWTTDAPFRETAQTIAVAAEQGAVAVEMEAAGLYAFAQASGASIICLAHVTNDMAVEAGDFEKGASNGAEQALTIVDAIAKSFAERTRQGPNP